MCLTVCVDTVRVHRMSQQRKLGHEIRNGMNALQLHAQVLKLCEGDELIESLDAIISSCDRLTELMDEVDQLPDTPTEPA